MSKRFENMTQLPFVVKLGYERKGAGLYPNTRISGGEQGLHHPAPGSGDIAAIVAAAAQRQDAAMAQPIGQQTQFTRRACVAGAREMQVRNRITGDTVGTALQDHEGGREAL